MLTSHLRASYFLALVAIAAAAPSPRAGPTVVLDQGTFVGAVSSTTNKFLNIPFAKPPTGDLRFRLPVPNDPYTGTYDASNFGLACTQEPFSVDLSSPILTAVATEVINYVYSSAFPSGEDCLNLNVWTPTNVPAGTKLPVVVWIFGGGFGYGATGTYDGSVIVNRSIELGEPIIYVSMNYRTNAFGFLGGKEVKAAGVGNLGLQDQRLALRWVQKYISAFGGDPTKVTIWGESAGAISAALHMVANNGNNEGLFRGAFLQSGSPIPTSDIVNGQPVYDELVRLSGCQIALDTLSCLRKVPFAILQKAAQNAPAVLGPGADVDLTWLPRADGAFITDGPQNLVAKGIIANIPFVTGDNDDEGTIFAISESNVTTDADFSNFLSETFLPSTTSDEMSQCMTLYPQDPSQGSPYNTGTSNQLSPQYKRLSSIIGDIVFQAPRRFFLQHTANKQNTWSFLNKRLKAVPYLGTFHASDLLNVYTAGDMADYLINFVNNLNPNGKTVLGWPKYDLSNPQLLTFQDGILITETIAKDNYRVPQMSYISQLSSKYPI